MRNSTQGFTLIEVLVALAILAIALTALVKATSTDIEDANYLQQKTMALYAAVDTMNRIQLGLQEPAGEGSKRFLGMDFSWKSQLFSTPTPALKRLRLTIHSRQSQRVLVSLDSFIQVKT